MKRYTVIVAVLLLSSLLLCGGCAVVLSTNSSVFFWVPPVVWLCLLLCTGGVLLRFRWVCTGWVQKVSHRISSQNRSAMESFPLPLLLMNEQGLVLFTNKLFNSQVMGGTPPVVDTSLSDLFEGADPNDVTMGMTVDLCRNDRRYTAYVSVLRGERGQQYLLYFTDDTELKIAADEYEASRPVVMMICVDNLEEATEHLRSGDRSRIIGAIETMLEDWITADGGVIQKYDNDRFVAVTEHRYLADMMTQRFPILNQVRQAFPEVDGSITISMGVAEGETMEDARRMAWRALDMALGRGGDQVAVKRGDEYDYFGGRSAGLEHRSRVRARIMADDLLQCIQDSDRVFVMGHRVSDLDCIGSGVALVAAVRSMQKQAILVIDRNSSMAGQLLESYDAAGKSDWFVAPAVAEKNISKKSLLIIVDTHSADMLELPSLVSLIDRVVVIDHHRRKQPPIDNLLLNYHDPSASSASELVAEMLPYLMTDACGRMEAEALLAGIMLDTRNFVIRTGVTTFEAAAYLRSAGADMVTVKKLFNENLKIHKVKNDLVSSAEVYGSTAIAVAREDLSDYRVAIAQAADDLLSVEGVKASFVVSAVQDRVHISARSYGECNVQLIMEALGGGGHREMAATQMASCTIDEAVAALKQVIAQNKE